MISLLLATAAVTAPLPDDRTDPASRGDEVVVTATGAEQSRATTGQAITVVTRADLERRQTVSLSDYLATTPGVTVTRNGGPGSFTGVRIRGAEAEQTLTLIDGVRVNDPSSPGGGFDFGNLLAGAVQRVEVLRGANSVAWGSQALGGIVNVVTEQPTDGMRVRGQGEYGYADSAYANAALAAGSATLRGSVTGGYTRTDGISAAAVGRERDGYRQYGGTGKLVLEPTPGIGTDVRLYYADSRLDIDGFPPPAFRFADTPEFAKTQELYGYAGVFANLADDRFRNRAAVTIAHIDRDNFTGLGGAPTFRARGRSTRYEYRGDFRASAALRIVGGAEHEDSRFTDRAGTRASTGITSIYGQAIVSPLRRVTLTGGVRHDDHEDFGGRTTFGGNAAVGLGRGTLVRATYAEGFKAPTLFQLFAPSFGTRTLRPEIAKSYDVGVEQTLGGATLSVTYFQRRTVNQIDFDLTTFTYANIARTRARGFETALDLKPTDRLNVVLNYSHIASRNRSPGANLGKQLARRPRDVANLSADWRTPWGPSLGGTVSIVGDSFDNAGNSVRLDGYALAAVRAELPVGDRFALFGRIDNLFDANYRQVAGYGTYGRAAYVGVRARLR